MRRWWVTGIVCAVGFAPACSGRVTGEVRGEAVGCGDDAGCVSSGCTAGECDGGAGGAGGGSGAGGRASGGVTGSPGDAGSGSAGAGGVGSGGQPAEGNPLTDTCFAVPPDTCSWGQVAAARPQLWSAVDRVLPLQGTGDLALELSRPLEGGAGQVVRAVAMDRHGGCVRPVSEERTNAGPTWSVIAAAGGGGVTAALLGCAYKFACGAELHVDGRMVASLTGDLGGDAYGTYAHRLAVGPDGAVFVGSGPRTLQLAGGAVADQLLLRSFGPGSGGATTTQLVDFRHVLGDLVIGPEWSVVLLLHEGELDTAPPSVVRRMAIEGDTFWQWAPGYHLDAVASTTDQILAAGVAVPGEGVTVTAIDVFTGEIRWTSAALQPGAVVQGFGVGPAGPVRLVTTAALDWGTLVTLDTGVGAVVGSQLLSGPPSPTLPGTPSFYGGASDGTLVGSVREWMVACAP